ncbi:hypothetical protein CLD20_17875 [Afifella sp. IM 167]|nr:hypothetical protein [Afifella sp. IM 167]
MVCIVAILCLVSFNVVMRYGLGAPVAWTHEVIMYLFTALVLIGIAVVFRRGRHLQLRGLVVVLPPGWQRMLRIVLSIVLALFFAFLIHEAMGLHTLYRRFFSPLNHMPRSWISLALLWSLISMMITSILVFLEETFLGETVPITIANRFGFAGSLSQSDELDEARKLEIGD